MLINLIADFYKIALAFFATLSICIVLYYFLSFTAYIILEFIKNEKERAIISLLLSLILLPCVMLIPWFWIDSKLNAGQDWQAFNDKLFNKHGMTKEQRAFCNEIGSYGEDCQKHGVNEDLRKAYLRQRGLSENPLEDVAPGLRFLRQAREVVNGTGI